MACQEHPELVAPRHWQPPDDDNNNGRWEGWGQQDNVDRQLQHLQIDCDKCGNGNDDDGGLLLLIVWEGDLLLCLH